jgi:hypothetical protein
MRDEAASDRRELELTAAADKRSARPTRRPRRVLSGALGLLALSALTAAPPAMGGPPVVLATVGANAPVSARGGWVVWSAPANGGWDLMAWHRGSRFRLPVASRPEPFDVNVGSDGDGRAVATFSRCATTPVPTAFFNDGPPAHVLGRGCHVRVLDLASGSERAAAIPHPAGASDTDPSMWRGHLAFARFDPARHADVEQVLLWSPRTRRLSVLPHGGMPATCPFGLGACRGLTRLGVVQGLDLDSSIVTFIWMIQAPAVQGHGGWEVRADRLDNHATVLIGSGVIGEVCTGPGTDLAVPSPPTARGARAWYSELDASCYVFTNNLVRFDALARLAATASLPAETLQLTRDGDALYALVAPPPHGQSLPTCAEPGAPCQIERLVTPALRRSHFRPRPPY